MVLWLFFMSKNACFFRIQTPFSQPSTKIRDGLQTKHFAKNFFFQSPVLLDDKKDLFSNKMSVKKGWQSYISTSFAPSGNSLTIFNTENVAGTITSIPITDLFLSLAVSPDGTTLYLANRSVATVSVLNANTFALLSTIPILAAGSTDVIPAPPPYGLIYVSNSITGTLTIISTVTNTVLNTVTLGGQLGRLAITPNGARLFVGQTVGGLVLVLDALTNPSSPTLLASIPVGNTPGIISITPDGTYAYVPSQSASQLTIINVFTLTYTTLSLTPGSGPYGSSILPNGSLLFLANSNNASVSVLSLLNKSTPQIVATINVDPSISPFFTVPTPDSRTLFVIDQNVPAHVFPIDVKSLLPGTPVSTPGIYQDITMSPDLSPIANFVFQEDKKCSFVVRFDASTSSSPTGTITQYDWNFGDGQTLSTTSPFVEHKYSRKTKCVFVTLRVTNSAGTSINQVWSSRLMSNFGSLLAQRIKGLSFC